MKNNVKYKVVIVVVLATIFGLAGGVVGEIVARVYILERAFNMPMFGDINYPDNAYGGSSLIIRNPSKVIVEQNTKIEESKNSATRNIVGIFKKKTSKSTTKTDDKSFNIDDYYEYHEELGNGLIVTSDGWILSDFMSEKMQGSLLPNKTLATTTKKALIDEYVIITSEKKIYTPDDIIFDPSSTYSFWHINEGDLPVKNFVGKKNLQNGELILATNWDGWVEVTNIVSNKKEPKLINSDLPAADLITLNEPLQKNFNGSFMFNLNSEVAALVSYRGEIIPTDMIMPAFSNLLNSRKINQTVIGINYINLSNMIKSKVNNFPEHGLLIHKNEKGVAIEKGSSAEKAGLKEGDIITSVNNIVLNNENELVDIISKQPDAGELTIAFIRNNEKKEAKILTR